MGNKKENSPTSSSEDIIQAALRGCEKPPDFSREIEHIKERLKRPLSAGKLLDILDYIRDYLLPECKNKDQKRQLWQLEAEVEYKYNLKCIEEDLDESAKKIERILRSVSKLLQCAIRAHVLTEAEVKTLKEKFLSRLAKALKVP